MLGDMAGFVFRYSTLFQAILLILKFFCSSCCSYDAYKLNVSRIDGIKNVVYKTTTFLEYCAVSQNVNRGLIDLLLSLLWSGPPCTVPFKLRSHVSIQTIIMSILLLCGHIESNPGPEVSTVPSTHHSSALNVGCVNAYSAVNKAALLHNAIDECKLDIRAVT
jgi:hypothetical protein